MLRGLTFDFWGTLYQNVSFKDARLDMLEETLKSHAQPRSSSELDAAYEHALNVWDQVWREKQRSMPTAQWLGKLLDYLDVRMPTAVMDEMSRSIEEAYLDQHDLPPVPGVTEVVPRLAQRYRLGLISDVGLTPGRVLREALRHDGLLPHFQVLTFSDETGMAKPRPEQFLRTLEAMDVQPAEAAHIGDLPETDLAGAHAAGMKAILFLGVSRRRDGIPRADGVFESYDELEELLATL